MARQISEENHRKSVQRVQEDGRTREIMKKKHAMECAKTLQEYEEGMQRDLESENEANGEVEGKDQGLKIKIEEILTLLKEMNRGQKEREEVKGRTGDGHSMVQTREDAERLH